MLNGRAELHIFDRGCVIEDRYCEEVLLPHVHLFVCATLTSSGEHPTTQTDADSGMGTPTERNVAPAGFEYAETVRSNHCRRPLQTSRREDHHIVRNARIQPTASSAAMQAQVAPSLGAPVSSGTIRKRLAQGHLG
ncbi:hypothetical protein TNCV_2552761 [Trichonephila clavipes]|nr:hypothetical protein TNCV_2552761 [Trichonephila clavipes]